MAVPVFPSEAADQSSKTALSPSKQPLKFADLASKQRNLALLKQRLLAHSFALATRLRRCAAPYIKLVSHIESGIYRTGRAASGHTVLKVRLVK